MKNTVLKYLEPYASSASELVTEILQYMEAKPNIEKIEAEALLAGITLDTKNFSFKTGVRTFEAASLLRRFGADTTVVRQFFQDDLETFVSKSNIVKNAKMYGEDVAISVSAEALKNVQLALAQGADELLRIRGVTTSFTVGRNDEGTVFISARSLRDVNVQVILEKLGGGGHMTIAGAQLYDVSIEKAETMLMKAIKEYFEGDEK